MKDGRSVVAHESKAFLLLLLLAALLKAGCGPPPELTQREIAGYSQRIAFGEIRLSTAQNFANQPIIYVDGAVRNNLDRPITLLTVNTRFRDVDGQVVFGDTIVVVNEKRPPLDPGQSRPFRMGFEGVPYTWNRQTPEMQVARLKLK